MPSFAEPLRSIISNDEVNKCDFDGIPAMRIFYTSGQIRRLMHYNGQGEVHRAGTDPAIVIFNEDNTVSAEMYMQHDRYVRDGGLPTHIVYESIANAHAEYHWSHRYGDEPPLPIPTLLDATLINACPICFDAERADTGVSIPACKHAFHRDCLTEWLGKQRTCPLCRTPV